MSAGVVAAGGEMSKDDKNEDSGESRDTLCTFIVVEH